MRLDNLLQAKYKNIPFFIRKESIDNIGHKRIVHDYPNSGLRYVEPLGTAPNEFNLEIFFTGENWQDDFKQFKNALEDSTPGRLYLPTFGIINNVVPFPTTANADQESVGEISLNITFSVTIDKPSPMQADLSSEDVLSQGDSLRFNLSSIFSSLYKSPNSVNSITSAIQDFKILGALVNNFFTVGQAYTYFLRNVTQNLKNSSGMTGLLMSTIDPIGLIQTMFTVNNGTQGFNNFKKMTTFGNNLSGVICENKNGVNAHKSNIASGFMASDPKDFLPNANINIFGYETTERSLMSNNRLLIVNLFRIAGINGMLEEAVKKTYTTSSEVDSVLNDIDFYYSLIIENDITGVLIPNLKADLDLLRSYTEAVLRLLRQNTYTVVSLNLEKFYSCKMLAYELYGEYIKNESQLNYMSDLLAGLNRSQARHAMINNVEIVTLG